MNIKKEGDDRDNMNEYLEQAKNFLNKANAKCEIVYGGISRNENWEEKEKRTVIQTFRIVASYENEVET